MIRALLKERKPGLLWIKWPLWQRAASGVANGGSSALIEAALRRGALVPRPPTFAAGRPILIPLKVLFVRRVEARQFRSVCDFIHDPGLHPLLLRRDPDYVLDERGRNQHRAIVVHDNDIVGIDGDAAAADRLLPIDEGETSHRGRRGCALAPDVKTGLENARHVAHDPVGDKGRYAALLKFVRTRCRRRFPHP